MIHKVVRSMSLDREVLRVAVTRAPIYGYKNTSDLVECLLKKWIESEERKL